MDKVKTSNKQKTSSGHIPKLKIKKGVQFAKHDPIQNLSNESRVAEAFWECLKENDPEGAMEIISAHWAAVNRTKVAKKAALSRSTLYYNLKARNPTIKTVAKLIHCCV